VNVDLRAKEGRRRGADELDRPEGRRGERRTTTTRSERERKKTYLEEPTFID